MQIITVINVIQIIQPTGRVVENESIEAAVEEQNSEQIGIDRVDKEFIVLIMSILGGMLVAMALWLLSPSEPGAYPEEFTAARAFNVCLTVCREGDVYYAREDKSTVSWEVVKGQELIPEIEDGESIKIWADVYIRMSGVPEMISEMNIQRICSFKREES